MSRTQGCVSAQTFADSTQKFRICMCKLEISCFDSIICLFGIFSPLWDALLVCFCTICLTKKFACTRKTTFRVSEKNLLGNSRMNLFLQLEGRKAVPVPVQCRVSDLEFSLEQTDQGSIKTLTALCAKRRIFKTPKFKGYSRYPWISQSKINLVCSEKLLKTL